MLTPKRTAKPVLKHCHVMKMDFSEVAKVAVHCTCPADMRWEKAELACSKKIVKFSKKSSIITLAWPLFCGGGVRRSHVVLAFDDSSYMFNM